MLRQNTALCRERVSHPPMSQPPKRNRITKFQNVTAYRS